MRLRPRKRSLWNPRSTYVAVDDEHTTVQVTVFTARHIIHGYCTSFDARELARRLMTAADLVDTRQHTGNVIAFTPSRH